ncbi:aldehyde dehydrogenase (NAD+) [Clonorchis sinensis]|uniref:Aldehyde dehydrogenase (NAD+) n=1 Tax=Clonorchis sinensis TaxID=79923 RepID=H2KS90_CLOSI|nr:aldehyde dehydrogenase (NAD+) [Clonorchis sinensis]
MTIMDTSYIQRQPLGVILIMGAWNYPLCTLLIPMLGALAAGNTVLLKPSEHCPTVARLLATLVPNYVDKKICQVLCGGVDVCQKLLASERFDHILYTGGVGGGRAVYAAAAKFLTPVTLELGGKCPVYVDSNVDLMMAAKRITVIKNFNCGQTCVAPDYVICHRKVLDEFLKNLGEAIEEFYGKDKRASPDLSRIINEMHWKRLTKLLSETKGKTVYGGEVVHDDLYIAPTVVIDVGPEDSLMSEELFGPILPILTVDSPKEAVELIRPRAHPLAVYVFTNSNDVFEIFKEETTSGALVQNDCGVQTLSAELPFGGVGQSGFGRYHGKHSIYTFSNPRSVMLKSRSEFINQRELITSRGPTNTVTYFGVLFTFKGKRVCNNLLELLKLFDEVAHALPTLHQTMEVTNNYLIRRLMHSLVPDQVYRNTFKRLGDYLRYNLLRTRVRNNRPEQTILYHRHCGQPKSLVHILQSCCISLGDRCTRHNRDAKRLEKSLRRLGYTVFEELLAPTSTSFIESDLIAVRERRATVLDVSIDSDVRGVTMWNEKKQKCGADECPVAVISALCALNSHVDRLWSTNL